METDKLKRLSIMTMENYVASTEPHTVNDPVITEEELSSIERILNGHTLHFTRALLISHNQGDMRRLKMAMHNESLDPPALRAVRKDHKVVPPEQKDFGPPSRPIGNGNNAPDSQLSWILATICQKAADSIDSESECDSTQDMLAAIDKENANPQKPSNQVCFSLDAVALYPSMEACETAEICSTLVVNSGLWIEAINWEEVALYLFLTDATEGISAYLLPTRKHSNGPKPSITTAEVLGPILRNKGEKSKFIPPQRSPDLEESKWMFKQMIKKGIITVMKNHTYKWNNSYRLQSSGGGIGDKLAQAAARLFMIWWDHQFLNLVRMANINVTMYKRFVDDSNLKAVAIDLNLGWDSHERRLVPIEVSNTAPDEHTANIVQQIANSVTSMLTFTSDFPSKHANGKMPVLDISMWTTETEEGTISNYEFYSKPMANNISIPAGSAVSHSVKLSTYRQMAFRVLRNTAIHLPWCVKARHLNEVNFKMMLGGYSEGFRVRAIEGGIKGFLNLLYQC